MKNPSPLLSALAVAMALAACGQSQPSQQPEPVPQAQAQSETLEISQAWSREAAPGAPVTGGFMTIHNGTHTDDRLLLVGTDAADRVEIHEMRHEDGMMRMRELTDGLPVPAGATVELKPGSYHLMFVGPRRQVAAGETIHAKLMFEHAGEREVGFEVRPITATDAGNDAGDAHEHH